MHRENQKLRDFFNDIVKIIESELDDEQCDKQEPFFRTVVICNKRRK